MDAHGYFSQTYFEARDRFLKAANDSGFEVASALNPNAKGPNNSDLFMDCAVSGPKDATKLMVVISGTHGPEGYCGSGVQLGLLESGIASEYAKDHKIAFIHANNPYGFAWDTRFNEDNIDLNRNFLDDFSKLPDCAAYEEVKDWATLKDYSEPAIANSVSNLMQYAQTNGFAKLQEALTSGQYKYQNGVYFGGFAPSWSNVTIKSFFDQLTAKISKMVIVDMHTGLGPFGHGEILVETPEYSDLFNKHSAIWGNEVRSTTGGDSISAPLTGCMDGGILRRYPHIDGTFCALEFGTLDPISVFQSTQASSWLHCHGDKNDKENPKVQAINQLSRDAFYPQGEEWANKVWQRSLDVIGRGFKSL